MSSHARTLLSKAWSGSSMQEGVSKMLTAATGVVKMEMPDDEAELKSLIQDISVPNSIS